MEEKRQALLADHMALRATFIALAPFISVSSTAPADAPKLKALLQMATELTWAEFRPDTVAEALSTVEELFSAIADGHATKDQPAPNFS